MFKKMKKIANKLILSFVVVTLVASIAGVVGATMLQKVDGRYSAALVEYGFSQGTLGRLGVALNEDQAQIQKLITLTDRKALQQARETFAQNATGHFALMDTLEDTNVTEQEQTLFAQLATTLTEYHSLRSQALEAGIEGDRSKAQAIWSGQAAPKSEQLAHQIEQLLSLKEENGTALSMTLTDGSRNSLLVILLTLVAGFIVSILIALFTAASISRPVERVRKASLQLACGDLDIHLRSDQRDEVAQMTNAFADAAAMMRDAILEVERQLFEIAKGNFDFVQQVAFVGEFQEIERGIVGIADALSGTLGQINLSADQVASGAGQIADGAQALSQGATEQASSVEELAAVITEITQQIRQSADYAHQAREKAELTGHEVEKSNLQVKEMIGAMGDISGKSSEIGRIVKTIEDIAFQTNILALNAAVEAARAGVAGKGFAVVADEVRNLASKSSDAAKGTTVLIEETLKAVKRGSSIAGNTEHAMQQVVEDTHQVAELIVSIAKAAEEQAGAALQVNSGIDQISAVVQTNSATSQQSAAASEELSGQARLLKELVNAFRLRRQTEKKAAALLSE